MKQTFLKTILLAFAVFTVTLLCAGDIDKAFKYLKTGDYPNARKFLNEVIAEQPENTGACYGLAKYFFAKDNPAYHIDSANYYIKIAAKKVPLNPDDKETKKLLNLEVRDYTITTLQKDINYEAYSIVETQNTVEAYQYFLDNFSEKGLLYKAENTRNQLAYIRAKGDGGYAAMLDFIQKYPNADQIKEAKDIYEKRLYDQTTADHSYQSYKNYLDNYPNGEYAAEAKKNYEEKLLEHYNKLHDLAAYAEFEKKYPDHPAFKTVQDSIYAITTRPGTVGAYKLFIRNNSHNYHIKEAWEHLYLLYTASAKENVYKEFAEEFPDFPDKQRIANDIDFSQKQLKPFERDGKWGYAYQPTKDSLVIQILPEYEEAYDFNGGLAAVRVKPCTEKCIYFYINKSNQRAIEADFNFAGDFKNGYAVVGIGNCEDESACKYGIIDTRGKYVVAPYYDVIEEESEGFYLVAKGEKFGFINSRGDVVVSLKYSDGLSFKQGVAAVAIDDNWFFIDKEGRQLFINRFQDVSSFSDSLCAVTLDGENWGYVDMSGNFVIQPIYESAEDFEGGFAVVSKKEKDPKNKSLFISQRYKIDRTGKVLEKLTAPKPAPKTNNRRTKK
ncbi:MAG: WG repeat-containing protein [Chitinophagales bacterium]|nr:WG repeat-containing protein [Chitinophagales bacterium]